MKSRDNTNLLWISIQKPRILNALGDKSFRALSANDFEKNAEQKSLISLIVH